MSKMISQLLAAVVTLSLAATAQAGRGGSYAKIDNAIATGGTDAIIAELERAERLPCDACIAPVLGLLDDDRYEVREAAAWWFARRPVMKVALTDQATSDLQGTDSRVARNAADILGTFKSAASIPVLSAALSRQDLSAEARQHVVRALGTIGNLKGDDAIVVGFADSDASVRLEALTAWMAIRQQHGAAAAVDLIGDSDASVRAKAAGVVGELREASARVALEAQLATDSDPMVRRNAAWALGRIGDQASRAVLETATTDASSLVRMTAKSAIYHLR